MGVEYTNRKEKRYCLHVGKTKTGKPKYYFSLKTKGQLAEEIPEGFEIYEYPANAQVFLRKKTPPIISELEKKLVEKELQKVAGPRLIYYDFFPFYVSNIQSRSSYFLEFLFNELLFEF